MGLPVYPSGSLPERFLLGTHTRTMEAPFEFGSDAGVVHRRPRNTVLRMFDTGTLPPITKSQVKILTDFYEFDCKKGAMSFKMKDQIDDTERTFSWAAPPSISSRADTVVYNAALSLIRES